MLRIQMLASIILALLLGACAAPITSDCAKNSICPILIYEKFPGIFATYPDNLNVKSSGGPQTLLWTFADASKYKFVASTDTPNGDGVELIGANGSTIGMTSCFVAKHSRPDFRPAKEGPYYRCEIVGEKDFGATKYIVRFRAMDGSPRMVDPTVSSTGSGDSDDEDLNVDPPVAVSVGQDVLLPAKAAGMDGIRVIWDSGSGSNFSRTEAPMVIKDSATGKEVDFQPCSPSSRVDGKSADVKGRYYACIFKTAAKPLAMTYDATYRNSALALQTGSGKVTRAP